MFGVCFGCCFAPVKQDKMLSVFVFLFFAWVRSVLGLGLKKGTENRTERTLGCSGRSSASPFYHGFACPNGQSRTARVRSCVTVGFYGFSFSEGFGSVIINSGKQTGLLVRNVRFWLVSPGFSSSFPSSSSSPVACRRNRRLLLLFSTTRRCFLTPPSRRFFSPNRLAVVRFLSSSLRPCVVSNKRYRTG